MERLPLFIEVEHAITSTTYNGHEAVLEVRAMTQLLYSHRRLAATVQPMELNASPGGKKYSELGGGNNCSSNKRCNEWGLRNVS